MQLWIVEHFHLHKKVPVVMNHNIQFFQMLWFITTGTFVKMKVFNYSELQFSEGTSFRIHTLIHTRKFDSQFYCPLDIEWYLKVNISQNKIVES